MGIVKDIIFALLFREEIPDSLCGSVIKTVPFLCRYSVADGNYFMKVIFCQLMIQKRNHNIYVYFGQFHQLFFELCRLVDGN